MPVGAITPYATTGINATYFTPVKRLYQPPKQSLVSAQKAYEVVLTTGAKVKALELQGYSISMISLKLGLDTKTINQYLGSAAAANTATFKTTYSPPKSTYVEPKPSYTEPEALAAAREQLGADLTQLTTVPYSAAQLISTAQKETSVNVLSQALTGGTEQSAVDVSSLFNPEGLKKTWLIS